MESLWQDLRLALRGLAKSPGFTVVAALTLALGIGANTAIFSVVNQVLLNPAGVAHPERIVSIRARYEKLALNNIGVSVPDFADVLHSTQQFDSAALINQGDFNYTGSTVPERLRGANVTGYKLRKGTIHFPLNKPVPVKLISRIAKLRAAGIAATAKKTLLGQGKDRRKSAY